MNLDLEIPEEVAELPRARVEAPALEGHRSKWFSEGQLWQMIGFSSRMQVHTFLKKHGVHLHYSLEDLEQDREISRERQEKISGNPRLAKSLRRTARRSTTWCPSGILGFFPISVSES